MEHRSDDVSTPAFTFFFRGLPVGQFSAASYPRTAGRYPYMPYRSVGHYQMGLALVEGPVRCSFLDGDSTFEFVVSRRPGYGMLQIESVIDIDVRNIFGTDAPEREP